MIIFKASLVLLLNGYAFTHNAWGYQESPTHCVSSFKVLFYFGISSHQ